MASAWKQSRKRSKWESTASAGVVVLAVLDQHCECEKSLQPHVGALSGCSPDFLWDHLASFPKGMASAGVGIGTPITGLAGAGPPKPQISQGGETSHHPESLQG